MVERGGRVRVGEGEESGELGVNSSSEMEIGGGLARLRTVSMELLGVNLS